MGERPFGARDDADRVIASDPSLLATMVGRGLTATMRPALPYLPSAPRGAAPERNELRVVYPEAGALTAVQLPYLDDVGLGWLPAVVIALAVAAGVVTLVPRARRRPTGADVRLVRAAAATALLALGVVGLAVLGDGYYELTKHVWLASYLLVVTAAFGACGPVAAVALRVRRHRRRVAAVDPAVGSRPGIEERTPRSAR